MKYHKKDEDTNRKCGLINDPGTAAFYAWGPTCIYRGQDDHALTQHYKTFHSDDPSAPKNRYVGLSEI